MSCPLSVFLNLSVVCLFVFGIISVDCLLIGLWDCGVSVDCLFVGLWVCGFVSVSVDFLFVGLWDCKCNCVLFVWVYGIV